MDHKTATHNYPALTLFAKNCWLNNEKYSMNLFQSIKYMPDLLLKNIFQNNNHSEEENKLRNQRNICIKTLKNSTVNYF